MNILFLLLQFTDVYFNLDCCIYFNQLYLLQLTLNLDIEAQIREIQSRKKEVLANGDEGNKSERIGLGESGYFDRELYDSSARRFEGYVTSIAANDDADVSFIMYLAFFV